MNATSTTENGRAIMLASRAAVLFTVAVGAAGAACLALYKLVPKTLPSRTDIAGYPTFSGWSPVGYFHRYYLIAIGLPLLATGFYAAIARLAPGRPAKPAMLPFRLADGATAHEHSAGGTVATPPDPAPLRAIAVILRLLLPCTAIYLASALVYGSPTSVNHGPGLALAASYLGVAALAGYGARYIRQGQRVSFAGVNAIGAAALMPFLLYGISRSSTTTLSTSGAVAHHPWIPLWLAAVSAVALLVPVGLGIFHPGYAGAAVIERRVLGLAVIPVAVYATIAGIPGSAGAFQGFDDAQYLAAPTLTFHGFFPWKDLYTIHGLLADVFDGQVGLSVFGDTRWGALAGTSLIVAPFTILMLVVMTFVLSRGSLILTGAIGLAFTLNEVPPLSDRFAFLPLFLLLFDRVLAAKRQGWCGLLMAALVIGAIITPEELIMAGGLLVTLVVSDLSRRGGETGWRDALWRTRWCAAWGAGLVFAWAVFLAATGALRAFVDYYVIFGPGHNLAGALPVEFDWQSSIRIGIDFAGPVVLALATAWRAVWLVRGRHAWQRLDWLLIAAATWSVGYYPKALGRADLGHFWQVDTVSMPLLILWLIIISRWLHTRTTAMLSDANTITRRLPLSGPSTWIGAVLIIGIVLATGTPLAGLRLIARHTHSIVSPEAFPGLGYTAPGTVNTDLITDLRTVIDTYAAPTDPIFDFSNTPGVFYFLLHRDPGSQFFHVSEAIPAEAQTKLISEIAVSRPKLVVFNSTSMGLPAWDGLSNSVRHYEISDYLLSRYTPLVDLAGDLVLIRNDLAASAPPLPPLKTAVAGPASYFEAGACTWGRLPGYLLTPTGNTTAGALPVPLASSVPTLSVRGWSLAPGGASADPVLAVIGGRVVATVTPTVRRDDVAQRLGVSDAFSGWKLSVAVPAATSVSFGTLDPDGNVAPLDPPGRAATEREVTRLTADVVITADGVRHRVVARGLAGSVDGGKVAAKTTSRLTIPAGTTLTDYHWFLIKAVSRFTAGDAFSITDDVSDPTHAITFAPALRGGDSELYVRVGSCANWHAYAPQSLVLDHTMGDGAIASVTLLKDPTN